ncbi:MAG: AsmA-like C-terminal domain-containing protein [Deltaproteobacteria bacterium]|nr:AsmA-like C-terminal domain-containing protein [Deltaproteobacteria bacterium]
MFLKAIRSSIKRAFLLFLMAVSLILLADASIKSPYFQEAILKRISNAIGYDIEAHDIELTFWGGVAIYVNDLSARSRKGHERFTATGVRLKLDIKSMLAGQIIPSDIYLYMPEIVLPWEKGHDLDSGLKKFLPDKIPLLRFPGIQSLVIEHGHVTFTDAEFSLEDLDIRANRVSTLPLKFVTISRGNLGYRGDKTGFELNGYINLPSTDEEDLAVDLSVKTVESPLTWFNWPASVRMREGRFNTRLDMKGNPEEHLEVKGMVELAGSGFKLRSIKKNREKEFFIPEATLDFKAIIRSHDIDVRPLKIVSDDLEIDMGLLFDLDSEGGPFLDMSFTSPFMGAKTFKTFFPSQLLPNWLEHRLFPMIAGGEIRIDSFSLKGSLEQIRHMKRPENRSIMEMRYECRDIEVSGGGVGMPFIEASAAMAFKDGLFSLSGLNARFGASLIKDSGMNIKDTFSPSRFYEFDVRGDFEISDLFSQRNMDIMPVKLSGCIEQWPDIEGRISCTALIGYQKGWNCPEVLDGDFFVKGFSMEKEGLRYPLEVNEARIHIDNSGSDFVLGSGSWGNSSFNMSANFGINGMMPYFKDGLMSADADMTQVFEAFNLNSKTPLIFSKTLPWHISLSDEGEGFSVKGHVDPEDTSLQLGNFTVGLPERYDDDILFELEIEPHEGRVDIDSAFLRLKESSVDMTGVFDLNTKRFLNIGLHSKGIFLKDLAVVSDRREVFSGGVLKGDLAVAVPAEDGDEPMITGVTEGTGLSFQATGYSPIIRDCSFRADFSGKSARLEQCDLKVGEESDLSITGDIRGWRDIEGDIKVCSDYLNLSDIIHEGSGPSPSGITRHMNLKIDLNASAGRFKKFPCRQAEADILLEKGNIYIKNSVVNLEYGDMAIEGHVLNIPEREMFFAADVGIKDQPAEELVEGLGIDYKGLKGKISIDGFLSVRGRGKDEMLSGLNGSGNVMITKGLIKNPSVMIKVLDFLSLQKIFEERPPDLREEGLYFESISADALIENGVLESKNFIMRSPVLNAVAEGSADIPNKYVSCTLFAQPHGTIDSLVSKVPVIGYIITGESKSVVAYPFDVKGSFKDPDVTYIPFETLDGGISGYLKRIFLTPLRLFDKIDKALNGAGEDATQ